MNLHFTIYRFSYVLKKAAFAAMLCSFYHCSNSRSENQPLQSKEDSLIQKQKTANAYATIDAVKSMIQSGDMITRTGADFTSESLRNLNQRDQTYSHCGIASIENDTVFVYHALGGDFNPDQKILRQPIEVFAQPGDNRGFGIFRFELSGDQKERVLVTAKNLYHSGIMFDLQFDLATDNRMYCAEYIYKSYFWGTGKQLVFATSHIKDFTFIGVDDLFLHPLCHSLKRIVYK